ncbi:hypothetical protein SBV1_1130036 [Verrucomicrobia bacterium]|nr:hypothetical protein SBV1_1130036 [Verrucomicrobiota bacterium]
MWVVFNQPDSASFSETGKSGAMVAMILSNQSGAASPVDRFESEQNNLPANTFEWTNRSGSASGSRFSAHPK